MAISSTTNGKPSAPPDPRFPVGSRVRVARPEGENCYRKGQVGTVVSVNAGPVIDNHGKTRTDDLALHTVEFTTDVTGPGRDGQEVNYGRLRWVGLGRCLDAVASGPAQTRGGIAT